MLIMYTQLENMMKHHIMTLAGLLLLLSVKASALQNDLQQEVTISAKSQEADIKNNQMIFNGPVKVTQGSITITADTLRAYSKEGNEHKVLIAIGHPATYSQKMENGLLATASAKEIRYDLSTRVLHLSGDAVLEQSGSKVASSSITYNIFKKKLTAQSGGKDRDRVTTVIKAENYQDNAKRDDPKTKTSKKPSIQTVHENDNSTQKTTASKNVSQPKINNDNRKQTQTSGSTITQAQPKKAIPIQAPSSTSIEGKPTAITDITPAIKNNWYIQVGVFAQADSQNKLIEKIKASGLPYQTYSTYLKGRPVTRLLIGPYQTLSTAKQDINKVQLEVEKNAYLYQLK